VEETQKRKIEGDPSGAIKKGSKKPWRRMKKKS
jgi:hypothetical protein